MKWHEVTIYTTEEAVEMISYHLHERGAGGVSIEESGTLNKKRDTSLTTWYELPLNDIPEGEAEIKGYFPISEDIESIVTALRAAIGELQEFGIDAGKAEISLNQVDDQDWAESWKQYYKPVRISERIVIKPTWEELAAAPQDLVIELDPGMAFGTGTHASTALCLRMLERVLKADDEVIDVGTGSGILAIAAAKLGAGHVLAIDLDPVAVSSARENTSLNQLSERITVHESDLLQAIRSSGGKEELGVHPPVDVVVANLLADIIIGFTAEAAEALKPGGYFIGSGIISAKENDVVKALAEEGMDLILREQEEDWVVLAARKKAGGTA